MKYLLYFHFYTISLGDSVISLPITTLIAISQDSLSFYIYDVGYIKWKIDYIKEEITNYEERYDKYTKRIWKNEKSLSSAIYFVSFYDILAIVNIRYKKAEIRILTNGKPILIQLKE